MKLQRALLALALAVLARAAVAQQGTVVLQARAG